MQVFVGNFPKIRGYTDKQSVAPGESIHFFIANLHGTRALRRPIRIFKLGLVEMEIASDTVVVPIQSVSKQTWNNNQWDVTYTLTVDRRWASGVYVARVGQAPDDTKEIFFVISSTAPSSQVPIVVQIPTTTINAYNNWGGASLYSYNSVASAAHAVSFDRPQQSDPLWPRGYGFEDEWELRIKAFVQWMELAGIPAQFMTSHDLHHGVSLKPYRLFISIGHDEYWSREMRRQFDDFIAIGGNAAIFGGNTCFWQIRFEPDEVSGAPDRRQVCYKVADKDPVSDPALKTVKWRNAGYPENQSFGAGCSRGAWKGVAEPGAFEVVQPDHWAFADTGLHKGDAFGHTPDEGLLGYETNGVSYARDKSGTPFPTGLDGTPADYLILALAELRDWETPGNAAMGVLAHPEGGTVFNAGTTDWAKGLETCISTKDPLRTVTSRITRNVITQLTRARALATGG